MNRHARAPDLEPRRIAAQPRAFGPTIFVAAITAISILLGALFLQVTEGDPHDELFTDAARAGTREGVPVRDSTPAPSAGAGFTDADAIYPLTPATLPEPPAPVAAIPTTPATDPTTTAAPKRDAVPVQSRTAARAPARSAVPTVAPPPPSNARDRAVAAVAGKGQYLYRWERIGTPAHVVAQAQAHGLSHLVVRAGNPVQGFYVRDVLADLLPRAHAAGIKVVAYDGPALEDIHGDVARAMEIVNYTAPSGDRIDALASDIERSRAPNLDRPRAQAYASALRHAVGPEYPLIAIVYNPNYHIDWYPFAELATGFDVFSPMDYWTGRTEDGAAFVRRSIEMLRPFGLPVSPIGQAYPIEVKGTYPPAHRVRDAMQAARDTGAVGMSFWSWETTRDDTWQVIGDFAW